MTKLNGRLALIALLLLLPCSVRADAIKPSDIYVIDGDTIRALGRRIRLVGFDAPELGDHGHSGLERMLAARATSRLRQMTQLSGDIYLQIVACACRPSTEGTKACNYGRACGYLTLDGQDADDVLIAKNLAHPLVCEKYSCPKRQSWCPLVPGSEGDAGSSAAPTRGAQQHMGEGPRPRAPHRSSTPFER
jgi:endonuclease YncB( thermonuclease family)